MKQLIQSYRSGELELAEVATPTRTRAGQVLVHTQVSLVNVDTEKLMIDLARKNILGKALARPDLVRQVGAKTQASGDEDRER